MYSDLGRSWTFHYVLLCSRVFELLVHVIKVLIGDFLATMSIYIPYTHLPALALAHGIKVIESLIKFESSLINHIYYHLSRSKNYCSFNPIHLGHALLSPLRA